MSDQGVRQQPGIQSLPVSLFILILGTSFLKRYSI